MSEPSEGSPDRNEKASASESQDLILETKTLDLTKAPGNESAARFDAPDHHSPAWAEIVKPVTRGLLVLLTTVMLVPFLLIAVFGGLGKVEDPIAHVLDWGKTILPPLVGFGGALVGYYYGTRGVGKSTEPSGSMESD